MPKKTEPEKMLTKLLKMGVDVDFIYKDNKTPFLFFYSLNQPLRAMKFVKHGADINFRQTD